MFYDPDERLFCTDVETSGLNPNNELLLQVAVIITDTRFRELATYESVIAYDPLTIGSARSQADDVVKQMHDETGLWAKCHTEGKPMHHVEHDLNALVTEHCPDPKKTRILGSSATLDKNFLDANMPDLMSRLHYRIADVSGLAWFAHTYFEVPYMDKKRGHEAMSDIRETLAEFAHVYTALEGGV